MKVKIGFIVIGLLMVGLIALKINANRLQKEMQVVELVRVQIDISLKAGGVHRCSVDVEEVNKNNLAIIVDKITTTDGSLVCYYSHYIGIIKAKEVKNIYLAREVDND